MTRYAHLLKIRNAAFLDQRNTTERSTTSKEYLNRLYSLIRLSFYDYQSKHPHLFLSQLWNFIPLILLYVSTYFFLSRFTTMWDDKASLSLALGLCCWNFFRESTAQASSIYNQKWKLIKNVPVDKFKLHAALTLSSFYSFLLNLVATLLAFKFVINYQYDLSYSLLLALLQLYIVVLFFNLLIAPICAIFRDGHQLWNLFLQVFIWCNPVFLAFLPSDRPLAELIFHNPLGGSIMCLYSSFALMPSLRYTPLFYLFIMLMIAASVIITKKGDKYVILSI